MLGGSQCSLSGLWLKICWCVLSLSHRGTPHTIGAQRLYLGFYCPHVCGLSHFEDLARFKKYFSVYSALEFQLNSARQEQVWTPLF